MKNELEWLSIRYSAGFREHGDETSEPIRNATDN
jgi:hypothetical protein